MEKITSKDLYKIVPKLEIGPIIFNFSELMKDEYFAGIEHHIKNQFDRSCSNKVISHVAITKSLFLMEYYSVFVDFTNNKFFTNFGSKEYYVECKNEKELLSIMDFYIKYGDYYHPYENYRNLSREIFDNMDEYEDKTLKSIWIEILLFSRKYFNTSLLMKGYNEYEND